MTEAQLWQLAEQVMTKDQHLTCWLRWNAEFSSAQIGQMLGITRQAVDARIRDGRERLRSAIEAIEEAA